MASSWFHHAGQQTSSVFVWQTQILLPKEWSKRWSRNLQDLEAGGQEGWTSTSDLTADKIPVCVWKWSSWLHAIWRKHLISDHCYPPPPPPLVFHQLGDKSLLSLCLFCTAGPLAASFTAPFISLFCYTTPSFTSWDPLYSYFECKIKLLPKASHF